MDSLIQAFHALVAPGGRERPVVAMTVSSDAWEALRRYSPPESALIPSISAIPVYVKTDQREPYRLFRDAAELCAYLSPAEPPSASA